MMRAVDLARAGQTVGHVRFCFLIPLLVAAASAPARDLPPINVSASAPKMRGASAKAFAVPPLAGMRGYLDERLGFPTFVSAPRGAVRQSGASLLISRDPAAIARAYLKSLAGA